MFIPQWLREYRREWLKGDVLAGLSAATVIIPTVLAYATLAGLPVQVGLYTAMAPLLVYAFVGTSRPLSISTTAAVALLTGAALGPVIATGDMAKIVGATAALSFLVGAILIAAGTCRLGFIADFISLPVLVGYQAGIGLLIVLDQIPILLGIPTVRGTVWESLLSTISGIPQASLPTIICSAIILGLLAISKRFLPAVPAPLIAVTAGIGGALVVGVDQYGISTVGQVPIGLPGLTLPDWQLFSTLWPAATGIALMSFITSIAAAQAYVKKDEASPQGNRELIATGAANIGGALFGAMPASAGTTQTAINHFAGASSQLCQCITFLVSIAVALALAPLLGLLPNAALSVIVLVYSVGLIKPSEFKDIFTIRKTEFAWAIVAMVGVVLLGTLQGILVAIIVSLIALSYQVADPPVHVLTRKPGTNIFRPRSRKNPSDESFEGILFLKPEGRLFFANAERVAQRMRPIIFGTMPKVVVLDLSGIFDLEYTALKMLISADQRLRDKGVTLWLSGLSPGVTRVVMRSSLGKQLEPQIIFSSLDEALKTFSEGKRNADRTTHEN